MNTKRISYLAAVLALATAGSACDHDEIYTPLEFSVQLDPSNTYRVGDPVVFNFSGNADYITAWNGDTGHEYVNRNRTTMPVSELETCQLTFSLSRRSGSNKGDVQVYVTNSFEGLSGRNAATDKAAIEAIEADNFAGWTRLEVAEDNRSGQWATTTCNLLDVDGNGTALTDNFTLLIRWHPQSVTAQRNYYINTSLEVKFKNRESTSLNYADLQFVNFNMADEMEGKEYDVYSTGSKIGYLQYGQNAGNIILNAIESGTMCSYLIDTWIFSTPMALNHTTPDTGQSIKGVTDDVTSFSYTYDRPGTYTATFVVANGNYQGESGTQAYDVTFTIVESIE